MNNRSYGAFARSYDRLTQDVDYDVMAAFILQRLRKNDHPNRIVLDAACGTGTLTTLLAEAGYEMIGTDASFEMLMQARSKAGEQSILYLLQPLEELDLYGTIGAAVCTLDSLNHLPGREALREALRRIGLFMEKDGLFICDLNTVYKHRAVLADNAFVREEKGVFCVWQNSYSPKEHAVEIDMDLFYAEKNLWHRHSESIREVAYEREELEQLFTEAGFAVEEVYDGYSTAAPCETTERLVYVLRKETNHNG